MSCQRAADQMCEKRVSTALQWWKNATIHFIPFFFFYKPQTPNSSIYSEHYYLHNIHKYSFNVKFEIRFTLNK